MTALAVGRPYSPPGIRMAHTIDLCVSDPVAIDMTVFDHWIEGLSIEEAATTVMAEEAEPLVADRQAAAVAARDERARDGSRRACPGRARAGVRA